MIRLFKILIDMAKTAIETLKKWFSAGKYPTGAQFASFIDSFRHKDDTIAISEVDELAERLNNKCPTSWGRNVNTCLTECDTGWRATDSETFVIGAGMRMRVRLNVGRNAGSEIVLDTQITELSYDEVKLIYDRGGRTISIQANAIDGSVVVNLLIAPNVMGGVLEITPNVVDDNNQLLKMNTEVLNELIVPTL